MNTIQIREQIKKSVDRLPWQMVAFIIIQLMILSVTVYAGSMFSMQHDIFPVWIAVPGAVAIALSYILGIVFANSTRSAFWSLAINVTSLLTDIVFCVLYALGQYKVIPDHPEGILAIGLAVAHGVPFVLMSVLFAGSLHASGKQEREDHAAIIAQQRSVDKQREEYRQAQTNLELKKMLTEASKLDLDIESQRISIERRRLSLGGVQKVSDPVSNPVHTPSRDEQRTMVVDSYRRLGKDLNVTNEAKRISISRATWYRLRDEARDKGELK